MFRNWYAYACIDQFIFSLLRFLATWMMIDEREELKPAQVFQFKKAYMNWFHE